MLSSTKTAAGLFSLAVCSLFPAWARDNTDVIVMRNGDRITCEITKLENGVLQAKLDYVDGTISIDWLKVARLDSKALFLIQLQNGTVYSANLLSPEVSPPARIRIQPEGRQALDVDSSAIVRMTQTSEDLLHRFSGSLSLGSTYSKGNNTAQYNLGSELDYTETRWGGKLLYNSNLSSSTGAQAATRNQVDLSAYRLLRWTNYFYAGTAGFLQSSVQGIRQQDSLGMGAGRFLKNTERVRFSILGGLGWQKTSYPRAAPSQQLQNIAAGLIAADLQVFSFKKTRLNIDATLAPSLTQQGRFFSKANATYYLKLFGEIDWNLSFYGTWDTQPPAHLPGSDYGTSAGLSWTFGSK